jgi:hypothetical protein
MFIFSALPSSTNLSEFARKMIGSFASHEHRDAQYKLSTNEYIALLAKLKPTFVHHPKSKQFLQEILKETGADLE